MPPGPNNPLGSYMMRLSLGSYLIHGSNDPSSVGRRSSSSCIHLYNTDIKQLYQQVEIGTVVHIVNQPDKLTWAARQLYLESHAPIDRGVGQPLTSLQPLVEKILTMTAKYPADQVAVNLNHALAVAKKESGIPTVIGQLKVAKKLSA
ncbi:MAG: L,D-transpeptidase family protein [Gammaproteobacteria bacterium]|nr:L,D-transpeptidase family protein [Gammaproteobacteria bacterium]